MLVSETLILSAGSDVLLRLYHNRATRGKRKMMDHCHPALEIALFKQGRGIYSVGDKEYSIEPGDIFLFGSNEKHFVTEIIGEEDILAMGIHFSPHFIWGPRNDMFDIRFLNIFLNRSPQFENRLSRNNSATAKIGELMLQIEEELDNKLPEYELIVKIDLLTILVAINRNYGFVRKGGTPAIKKVHMKEIERVMALINAQPEEELSLDILAKHANMSRSYFSYIFKTLNGVSAWDYIVNKRIEKAIGLLTTAEENLIEIANQCGFNNSTNFNRAFKKVTGIVPSKYRKMLLKAQTTSEE